MRIESDLCESVVCESCKSNKRSMQILRIGQIYAKNWIGLKRIGCMRIIWTGNANLPNINATCTTLCEWNLHKIVHIFTSFSQHLSKLARFAIIWTKTDMQILLNQIGQMQIGHANWIGPLQIMQIEWANQIFLIFAWFTHANLCEYAFLSNSSTHTCTWQQKEQAAQSC